MVQLQILSGKKAGTRYIPTSLPMTAGRAGADLCLEDNGVWNRHFVLACDPVQGVMIRAEKDALLSVNGEPILHTILHTGDIIAVGGVTMRFDLSPVRQSSLTLSEAMTWIGLTLLCLVQLALILQLAKH